MVAAGDGLLGAAMGGCVRSIGPEAGCKYRTWDSVHGYRSCWMAFWN